MSIYLKYTDLKKRHENCRVIINQQEKENLDLSLKSKMQSSDIDKLCNEVNRLIKAEESKDAEIKLLEEALIDIKTIVPYDKDVCGLVNDALAQLKEMRRGK